MLQSIMTASIESIVVLSAAYFAIGCVLHMATRLKAIQPKSVAIAPIQPVEVEEVVEEPVQEAQEEFSISDVIPVIEQLADEIEVIATDYSQLEVVKLPLEEMSYKELQDLAKSRFLSIRIGSRWAKKTELVEMLADLGH